MKNFALLASAIGPSKHALPHGGEKAVLGDAGYQGVGKRPESAAKEIDWHTAMRPSVRKALEKNQLGRAKEKLVHGRPACARRWSIASMS